ncbi:MAG TPA: CYTH domain-containing protein, partial [Acidimicrobiales bacterium]|nr:CYTH domain-containing protein [Acidimicrobiales bacterium]
MAIESLEREIKLDVDLRFEMPDLSALASGCTLVPLPVQRLAATYYDTPDLQLLRRGITLRRREDRVAGGENLWTLKLPTGTVHA